MAGITRLGTVLVSGGCGFLGYHLVRHLLEDTDVDHIWIVDRNIANNRHEDKRAVYVQGDIQDASTMRSVLSESKPSVIFHAASPLAALPQSRAHEFADTNIKGTEILLTIAAEADCVRAFVYTSSMDVYANAPWQGITEDHPLWRPDDRRSEYNRTKAIADTIVRASNAPNLRTACVRPSHMYGERQVQGLVEALDVCAHGKPLFQVGDGQNLFGVVSARNTAMVHIAVAKALLDPSRANGRVDGEAFNATDGVPVTFWHHQRVIWMTARGVDKLDNLTVIPTWVMATVVFLAEWLFFIASLGTIKPPATLRWLAFEYCTMSHTISDEKARSRLGFRPVVDHDAEVARAARWMLQYRDTQAKTSK